MNPNRKGIALTAGLRAGKDTVANYLCAYYNFTRDAFGNDLKRAFHSLFPDVPLTPKPVDDYCWFGETMRQRDPMIWVNRVDSRFNSKYIDFYGGYNVVISDLRNPLEYEWAKKNGFTIIRINAKGTIRLARAMQTDKISVENLTKPTELYFDKFDVDYEVANDGSLSELYAQIDEIMSGLGVARVQTFPDGF